MTQNTDGDIVADGARRLLLLLDELLHQTLYKQQTNYERNEKNENYNILQTEITCKTLLIKAHTFFFRSLSLS
jgi:hypothetical protein